MNFQELIDALWKEVKEETDYNKKFAEAQKIAEIKMEKESAEWEGFYTFMNKAIFPRLPRKSVIKANLKMIRRLSIKYEKDFGDWRG